MPVIVVTAAGAIELAEVQTARSELQNIVDAAAVKGARELQTDQSEATAVRTRLFADHLAAPLRNRWSVTSEATLGDEAKSVTVTQRGSRSSFFGNLLPPGGFQISATATARLNSSMPLCVLGLGASGSTIVDLQDSAAIAAQQCLVHSDGDIGVNAAASLSAGRVQSVGATRGPSTPAAITDMPSIPDPFATLPINVPDRCDDYGMLLFAGLAGHLAPGVHCGAIIFFGLGELYLEPGEHYFLNGNIMAFGSISVVGTDVVLILKGNSQMSFVGNSGLALEGRHSGPYAGFVLITDRSYTQTLSFSTTSARKLHGTVYLPNAALSVSGGANNMADQSPWTVIVAHQVSVSGSAHLVINSDYSAKIVPVPNGVGPGNYVNIQN